MFSFLKKKTEEEKELIKNSSKMSKGLSSIFVGKKIDEKSLEELEELLISADINVYIVEDIIKFIRNNKFNKEADLNDIKNVIYNKLLFIFKGMSNNILNMDNVKKPYVLLFLGVNGSGKTTFIGKLANKLKKEGKRVLLAGCDTFRVGASEQLKVWADRVDVDIILKENEKKEIAKPVSNEDMLKSLIESQTVMNYAFAGFKTETEQKFNEVNIKIDEHDVLIKKKIQLAPNEARTVREKIKEKVKHACEENGLEYHRTKARVFPRVYKAINDKYAVATYRELPSFYFKEILQDIEDLTINIEDLKNQVA